MLSAETTRDLGTALRLPDGSLGILVARLAPPTLLILKEGLAQEIAEEALAEFPARCPSCGLSHWWWGRDFRPHCLRCERPEPQWRADTWAQAERAVAGMEGAALARHKALARRVLDHSLSAGRLWYAVQRMAFADDASGIWLDWVERRR